MLNVKTPEEAAAILAQAFPASPTPETVPLSKALGRVLYAPVTAVEYVPGFDRSTVDGFALRAADTFGCSDAIPAILPIAGEILMGEAAPALPTGHCMAVPTGGAVPEGADAVVMLEYCEDYGDGSIGVSRPAAPGENMIFKGDDVFPGKAVLPAGRKLGSADIGALAALGLSSVTVCRRPLVGVISTGDEIVDISAVPSGGQIRDVNSAMLCALCEESGADALPLGIVPDNEELLAAAVDKAMEGCDMLLISGGSSVGTKDSACRVIAARGEILLHGIAMKPGKPTIFGKIGAKPVIGLPGHPAAAFFVAHLFVRPLIAALMGRTVQTRTVPAVLTETLSANHGRAQYTGVFLSTDGGTLHAKPIRGKSGLITALAASDGYICIPRDCEGVAAGSTVYVTLYSTD